jgi:tRNA U34 2-thiouridine synthase MnmA/TrmU
MMSNSDGTRPQIFKAVGLLSGGLDSTLAAQVIKDLGFDIHAIYFAMPWGCCDKGHAQRAADRLGIKLIVLQLDERYLEIVRNPKYGYGTALNPCVDCRIHMFSRAAQYMKAIGAEFVFTGEVLGQRPMSQKQKSMRWIEESSGLKGRLLRPLSAHYMEPTEPEQQGIVNRARLLGLNGRSRKEQIRLAEAWGITEYPAPAGGCLLTDQTFARRMKDTLTHGYRDFRETIALKWGRHFRLSPEFKAVLGRDEEENKALTHFAHSDDLIFELEDKKGPTLILKGGNPPETVLQTAAGLVQWFCSRRHKQPQSVQYWKSSQRERVFCVTATPLNEDIVQSLGIS